jgi:hypothetical protein
MQQEHARILLRVMFRYAILKLVSDIKEGLDTHVMVLFYTRSDYVSVVQELGRLFICSALKNMPATKRLIL